MSKTITLSVPDEMYSAMREFPEINYSELARQKIADYLSIVKEKEDFNPNQFLVLKDLIFTREKIIRIHGMVETKNAKLMNELSWVSTVFDLNLLDSLSNFLYTFPRVHPFEDGNKRTAFVCVDSFLRLNNFRLNVDAKKSKTTEDEKFFWQNANQQKIKKQIKEFLQEHMVPCRKPNSVEQAISDSIAENKQLLANLATE
ncbi:Fic/DOC family protein [uncultured archaeon]|nr:Fic/DOC family protein [uncultured archaeon]